MIVILMQWRFMLVILFAHTITVRKCLAEDWRIALVKPWLCKDLITCGILTRVLTNLLFLPLLQIILTNASNISGMSSDTP